MGRTRNRQRRIAIEQGIARGWPTRHIADTVGCPLQEVIDVARDMDIINNAPDQDTKRPRPAEQPSVGTRGTQIAPRFRHDQHVTDERDPLADAMRAEVARIYGNLQREHHNGAA